jgi:hypothetical protein
LSAGTYQFSLFRDDGFTKLATSNNFTVTVPSGSATVTVTPGSAPAGGSVTVAWSGIAGPAAMDWFALYQQGAANASYLDWRYVSCTQKPGAPMANGSCVLPLAATLAAGPYDIRLFRNDGFTLLATTSLTVTSSPPPTLTASPSSVVRGNSVTATWSGIVGGTTTSWIGIYATTAADNAFINWRYLNCTQTPGGPVAAGTCAIPVPASTAPGQYQLRLFRTETGDKMATSNNFTVTQ